MFHQLKSYLYFLMSSKNEHAIHSPFIFEFYLKALRNKKAENGFFEKYRSQMLKDKTKIKVQDFGAGSKVFKSDIREVSKIAQNAGISSKYQRVLFGLIQFLQPENILEIGTSLGLATSTMASAAPKAKITTLEGCPETAGIAEKYFDQFNLKNIKIDVGNFSETLPKVLKSNQFDFIFLDGNHQKAPTIQYFEESLDAIHNNSIMVFDDIHWSKPMEEAWKIIKEHPKVTVTIDTFQWGIVFFRKEQPKEHFILRV